MMTATAKDLFEAGKLQDAIQAQTAEVRAHPTDGNRRGFLAELLCFAGNLDRADLQLDALAKQDPAVAVGVALFRQVIRGELARRQVFAEGRLPEFLDAPPGYLTLHLEAIIRLREQKPDEAAQLLERAEAERPILSGRCDGRAFEDIRDLDDVTASFFEVITSTGKYYWIPVAQVERLEFHKPQRPRDLLWRRALMAVANGPDGEVFLPATYVAPEDLTEERVRLGRVTDWIGGDGVPVRGIGQRSYLIGDESMPILQIGTLEFERPADQPQASGT